MADELDYDEQTGKHYVFARKTMWHKKGHVLTEAPSYEKAIELIGANREVKTHPIFIRKGEEYIQCEGHVAIKRDGKRKIYGTARDKYVPLQDYLAYETLVPLVDKGIAEFWTGGMVRNGEDSWMMVKFNIDDPVVQETFTDKTIPFILFTNNHSGKRGACGKPTPIEVVCANTLSMASAGGFQFNIRHRGNARVRLVDAATEMFATIVDRYKEVAEQYKLMKETILSVEEFTSLVLDTVAPIPLDRVDRAIMRRDTLKYNWETSPGNTGNHSAWEAYNAVTYLTDHTGVLYNQRKTDQGTKRLEALMDGKIANIKDDVVNVLVKHCRKRK